MRGLIIAVVLIALVGCTETAQTPSVSFEEMENFIQQAYQLRTNAVTNPGTLSLLSQLYASSSSKLQEYEQRRAEFWRNWGNLHGQVLSFTSTVSLIPGTLKQIGLTTSVEAYEILTITWKPDTTTGMKNWQEKLAQAKTDEERKQAEQAIENIKAFPQIVNTEIGVTHSLELAWTGQGFQIIKDGYSEVSQGREFPASPDYLLTSPTPTPTPTSGGVSVGVWEQLPSFGGEVFWCLAIDPSNPQTLYAGTGYGGVWKSSDGGANWAASSRGLTDSIVYSLAIDPGNPQTLYAGTVNGGAFKSSDGGASWAASSSGLPNSPYSDVWTLVIDSSGILYALTSAGLFRMAPEQ
jgi:hypothetical protein